MPGTKEVQKSNKKERGGSAFARLVSLALEKKLDNKLGSAMAASTVDAAADKAPSKEKAPVPAAATAGGPPPLATAAAKQPAVPATAPNYTLSDSDFPPLGAPTKRR